MKLKKRDPLRTEAALKKAIQQVAARKAVINLSMKAEHGLEFWSEDGETLIALADLRDLYRKRQPLRGITKAVRRAVHPRSRR